MSLNRGIHVVAACMLLMLLMGHDHGCGGGGAPTGANCDPDLGWENLGREFMTQHCTSCHSAQVRGELRRGAPSDHNFDTLEGVQVQLEHIEVAAAGGPEATNEVMPPYGPMPTALESQQLAAWLACGAP